MYRKTATKHDNTSVTGAKNMQHYRPTTSIKNKNNGIG